MWQNKKVLLLLFSFILCNLTFAQNKENEIIQINGVTMTADSLMAVPFVTVTVKDKNRGVVSNQYGIFSIVCYKGETLNFSAVGFRDKEFEIEEHIDGQFFNLIQLMVQDTFYLPETIINPIPRGRDFDYAFKYWDIENDPYAIAKRNTNPEIMAYLRHSMPKSGRENQSYFQMQQAKGTYYYGQQQPMNVLNPLKWNEFLNAWKRGDFRKKR